MLSLITPTHNRPEAFQLCEKWMKRQDYQKPYQWIVVSDGNETAVPSMGQEYIRREPTSPPRESFRQNYLAALERVRGDHIVFIEDDDWYSPDYLTHVENLMVTGKTLCGQRCPKYYNIRHRMYHIHSHAVSHTSLCQTIADRKWLPTIQKFLQTSPSPERLDTFLWKRLGVPQEEKRLEPRSTKCVGMKGMSTEFVGCHHLRNSLKYYQRDSDGSILRSWIGGDAEDYLRINFNG